MNRALAGDGSELQVAEQSQLRRHLEGQTFVAPAVKSSGERPHVLDPQFPQLQRRTGAGGFVGSSAIENDFAVTRDLAIPLEQFLRGHTDRSGKGARVGEGIESMAEVNDEDRLTAVQLGL